MDNKKVIVREGERFGKAVFVIEEIYKGEILRNLMALFIHGIMKAGIKNCMIM